MRILHKVCMAGALILGAATVWVTPGNAVTESVKYSFCSAAACADGNEAEFPMLRQGAKYYGTTLDGGANGAGGVIFRYNSNTGNYAILYSFCATTSGSTCTDGKQPTGPLIMDVNGNLYGTTEFGGAHNAGTAFELVKPVSGPWTLTKLYDFCASTSGSLCLDGLRPLAGLSYVGNGTTMYDGSSILYGTASEGGNDMFTMLSGRGVVYALRPPMTSGLWQQEVIHSFCAACGDGCATCSDGILPDYDFVVDGSGNIWGTTANGGSNAKGTAWELTPGADPWSDPWTETILYNFCWANGAKCPDGWSPNGITMDSSGHLFGTTFEGGNGFPAFGGGVLFKLTNGSCTEGGTATFWCNSALHGFCPSSGCSDGEFPNPHLVLDGSGNIIGTAAGGGTVHNGGNVFNYNTGTSTYSTVYNFCPSTGCSDGAEPETGITLDNSGDYWGVTLSGGVANQGVIYEVVP